MPVTIACGQLNQTVGDLSDNLDRIERCARDAAGGAQVLSNPERSLSGYPPEDLLFRAAFYAKAEEALRKSSHDIGAIRIPSLRSSENDQVS